MTPDVVFDHGPDSGPGIFASDEVHGSVLPIVARDWVIMFVPEDSETKVLNVQNIDVSVKPEETGLVDRPP